MTRPATVLFLLAVAALPAAPQEEALTAEQLEVVRRDVGDLRRILDSDHLTAADAAKFEFRGFDADDLARLLDTAGDLVPPGELRAALERVCRTAIHRRGPLGKLEKAADICFLLAGEHRADWMDAYRFLRRERLSADHDRATIALGGDARPGIRLMAARHATTLLFFGRDTEGLVETVHAAVTDPDPNVVADLVGAGDLTGDKRFVDRMVAGLSDDRALDPVRFPGPRTVRDVLAPRLSWEIWKERRARMALRGPAPGEEWRPLDCEYVALEPDEIRAWWKENRATFAFGTPQPMWKRVFGGIELLERGVPVFVRLDSGEPLRITLREYREGWDGAEPVTTIEVEVVDLTFPDEEQEVATMGNPRHSDWFIPSGRTGWSVESGDGSLAYRAAFLPTHRRGQVRMKLVIHVEHE